MFAVVCTPRAGGRPRKRKEEKEGGEKKDFLLSKLKR